MTGQGEWNWRYERRFFPQPALALNVGGGARGWLVEVRGYRSRDFEGSGWCWVGTERGVVGVERIAKRINPEAVVVASKVSEILKSNGAKL